MYLPVPMFDPTSDRVLVRKVEQTTTTGGIMLNPSTKMMFERGVVVKVGPGKVYDNGVRVEPKVKEGDFVLFAGGSAADIRMKDETLWLMTESAILGIVPPEVENIVAAAAKLPANIVTASAADMDNIPERTPDVM